MLKRRPFTSSDTFLDALDEVIEALSQSEKVKLLLSGVTIENYSNIFQIGILEGHPDLAGRLADANLLTPESTR